MHTVVHLARSSVACVVCVVCVSCVLCASYDADRDHTPHCNQGNNAHWCLVMGYAFENVYLDVRFDAANKACINAVRAFSSESSVAVPFPFCDEEECANYARATDLRVPECCVFAYHGKSLHPSVWRCSELVESNAQLRTLDMAAHPGTKIDAVLDLTSLASVALEVCVWPADG